MTIRRFHRITAMIMAGLMFLTSTGFSMDIHYCQDMVKSISFLGKAKNCHEMQTTPSCHKKKASCTHTQEGVSQEEKNKCCHNENLIVESLDTDGVNLHVGNHPLNISFVIAFVASYLYEMTWDVDYQIYNHYKPPIPDRDFRALFQSFLI